MKLKEAQMLGILALLAVGTVLLCMWGGDDVPDDDQTLRTLYVRIRTEARKVRSSQVGH